MLVLLGLTLKIVVVKHLPTLTPRGFDTLRERCTAFFDEISPWNHANLSYQRQTDRLLTDSGDYDLMCVGGRFFYDEQFTETATKQNTIGPLRNSPSEQSLPASDKAAVPENSHAAHNRKQLEVSQ